MVLENIKYRLRSAFRGTSAPCKLAQSCNISTNAQADEELRRAQIDGAITWVRSELLEMRCQDRQLAKTLLELNSEVQTLRREREPEKCPGSGPAPAIRHQELGAYRRGMEASAIRRAGRKHT